MFLPADCVIETSLKNKRFVKLSFKYWNAMTTAKQKSDISTHWIHCFVPFQPGESGFVLLGDLTVETSTDPEVEGSWTLGDPPSPCDVRFQNDNVIINGKSNIRDKSRDQKVFVSTFQRKSQYYNIRSIDFKQLCTKWLPWRKKREIFLQKHIFTMVIWSICQLIRLKKREIDFEKTITEMVDVWCSISDRH